VSAAFSRWSLDDSFSAVTANTLLSKLPNSQTPKLLNSQGQAELAKVESYKFLIRYLNEL